MATLKKAGSTEKLGGQVLNDGGHCEKLGGHWATGSVLKGSPATDR